MNTATDFLEISGLRKVYPGGRRLGRARRAGDVVAVDGIDLRIGVGECFGLLGPNGAGKTTAVRILATVHKPDAGTAEVLGYDVVNDPHEVRMRIGLAGQYAAVDPNLTGRENLRLMGRLAQVEPADEHHADAVEQRRARQDHRVGVRGEEPDREVRRETLDVLNQFGLARMSGVPAGGLAQGERKLLDVAVAYALRPKLLFLDEPTSGVSTRDKTQIMDTVSAVVRAGAVTAVVIEHDMDVVFRYSDRIVMMHEGKFLADGTPEEIKANRDVANILLGAPLSAAEGQARAARD